MNQSIYQDIIAVTSRHLCRRPFREQMHRVCSLHPRAVILREKDLDQEAYLALAAEIKEVCDTYQVQLIPHTYLEAANTLGSRQIHLPLPRLRALAQTKTEHSHLKIGCSIHSLEEAEEAVRLGASYLTAGNIYETDCKKGLPGRGTEFLTHICHAVNIPVYAIGGIQPDPVQIRLLRSCGAAGACIMSGMMYV